MTSDFKPSENTFCVIMAGGIGSRFWPMSTPEFPKLRNTAPCLAYANFWISKKNKNATIIVLSADQLITNEISFLTNINQALSAAKDSDCLITLGIKPTEPNTGYGYIKFENESLNQDENLRKVSNFTEKPDLENARKFIQSGDYFWNAGIFIWSLKSIQIAFKRLLPDIYALFNEAPAVYGTGEEHEFINRIYKKCQNISIDYGILEKSNNVQVILSEFGWSDLGTWGSVYNHLPHDENSNAVGKTEVALYESTNNVVRLSPNMRAVIQGLDGYIVVESEGNLLICKRDQQQRIKEFSKSLH